MCIIFGQAEEKVNDISLSINYQSLKKDVLELNLINSSESTINVASFDTYENRLEIYNTDGILIRSSFIVCNKSNITHQVDPGTNQIWTYKIQELFFENPLRREKLKKGNYRIRWVIEKVSWVEFKYEY